MPDKAHSKAEHEEKMCALTCCPHDLPLEKIKSLVKGAAYVCKSCGRAAADAKNLCQPVKI
jgi:hypothetical protein